jgi:hypothetical protein
MWGTAGSVPFSTIPQDHKFTHSLVIDIKLYFTKDLALAHLAHNLTR